MSGQQGYIYGIREKETDEYVYIGSTTKTIAQRFKQHLTTVKTNTHHNNHFQQLCDDIGIEQFECVELDQAPLETLEQTEYTWIQRYFAEGHPLTNIVRSEGQNQRMIVARTARPQQYAKAVCDIVRQMTFLTLHELKWNKPLFCLRPRSIATLRKHPEFYSHRANEIETWMNLTLDLYLVNTNGLSHVPLVKNCG